jgi:hypothetical protein
MTGILLLHGASSTAADETQFGGRENRYHVYFWKYSRGQQISLLCQWAKHFLKERENERHLRVASTDMRYVLRMLLWSSLRQDDDGGNVDGFASLGPKRRRVVLKTARHRARPSSRHNMASNVRMTASLFVSVAMPGPGKHSSACWSVLGQ